ncbi:hypothetical protein AMIS_23570 [Actinoplanes missouriensis 431]|uniref:Uncharacterized protein n=1 Tax=Actinoplanes missouriensis (strain ATCC 14538 / DSM 43046 / CBS 188.64 / JCM 3121 / NBRC 102363 / NCIMB 12654 / NRRL B-3342 / UNCC 431) TaxID=512565 RepID=I0H3J0_ACTM4|nr:hypothetical protein [Actinoplanes missouriensis]BAL87577.1 hypothetical protein AMIS_23570 [Actinoplanes missouriensis 431]
MSAPDYYFALIHARTSIPNQWVEGFYHQLDLEVRRRADPPHGLRRGSLYYPTAGDARWALEAGIPSVRVLVPLYSREFLHEPPPDFGDRLYQPGDPATMPFVHPVLWEPHLPARRVNGLAQATSLGTAVQEYGDYGMVAICRLSAYTEELRQLIEELADRLVTAAENPDQVPPWLRTRPELPMPARRSPAARFQITVVRPRGRGVDWSPFGTDVGWVTDRARDAAQRLSLLPEIVLGPAAPGSVNGFHDTAGVLLLDAAVLDDPPSRLIAEGMLRDMPSWMTVVMVMVIRPDGDDRSHELVAQARAMTRNGVQIARDAREFQRAIDEAVIKARRNFLRSRRSRGPWGDLP